MTLERAIHPDPNAAAALRRLYFLTQREAEVAIAVARGAGLRTAADALGIGVNTVRTHLQRVFEKTGTSRQAELAITLMRQVDGMLGDRHDRA